MITVSTRELLDGFGSLHLTILDTPEVRNYAPVHMRKQGIR